MEEKSDTSHKEDKQTSEDDKWEKRKDQMEKTDDQWGKKSNKDGAESSQGNKAPSNTNSRPGQSKLPCEICGFFNHATKNCRRLFCEICGLTNHMAYDYKQCIPWNCGLELCATQVEEQSFFFIEENIDPRISREKECTAIITISSGQASGKDVEREFMNAIGSETWKWTAKQIAENKFIMRFPNAKILKEWSYFPALTMRTANAQMKIDAYTACARAKGQLHQAWFKVWDIPPNQRSIRTVAKVGGLVGKVLEIDEKTRFRHDYVRMKIACRDVTKVPRTAESALGMSILDFHFEREVERWKQMKELSIVESKFLIVITLHQPRNTRLGKRLETILRMRMREE